MESEFTSQLKKLWEDIESVCGGESRPDTMSDAVYDECLQWRRAFPNPDLHRFVKYYLRSQHIELLLNQFIRFSNLLFWF